MPRHYRHGNGRIQHRAGGGRFRHSTLGDVGLAADVCPSCNGFNARGLGAPPPETCQHCGAVFVRETCAWRRKAEPLHLGPEHLADLRSGAFTRCGKIATAFDLELYAYRCADHLDTPTET